MIEPTLVPSNALVDVDVGVSVSTSADLLRLGLDVRHAEVAIAEITRAILLAGGRLTYGGRIRPSGFTQQLMNEVRRYGVSRPSLTICLALPEHTDLSREELDEIDRQLGTWGRLVTLDAAGSVIHWVDEPVSSAGQLDEAAEASAYSSLRRYMASRTSARVLVGGQLRGYRGVMPGVVEEAMLAIEQRHPLYMAGGFGGAAAAAAATLGSASFEWLAPDLPLGHDDSEVAATLERLRALATSGEWRLDLDGLTDAERELLASSHRPGEIASLAVLGMSRVFKSASSSAETEMPE